MFISCWREGLVNGTELYFPENPLWMYHHVSCIMYVRKFLVDGSCIIQHQRQVWFDGEEAGSLPSDIGRTNIKDTSDLTSWFWWLCSMKYWSSQHQGHVRFNFNQTSRHKPLCSMKYTSNCCVEWNISPQNIMDYTLPFVSMKRQKYIEWC